MSARQATVATAEVLADLTVHYLADQAARFDLIRIPSVSTDPRHAPDVRRAACVAERLRAAGPLGVQAQAMADG